MAAGGFKMSLGGLKAKPGLKAVAAKRDAKPKKALLGDDEPEDTNKAQEIAGFDAAEGGAIDINGPKEKKGPLVIPTLPNRSWRDEARKKQLERAPHTQQQQQQNGDVVMDEPEAEVVYGLTVPTKPSAAATPEPAAPAEAMDVDPSDTLTEAQRLDKQALESLLTGKATDTQRVVPAISDEEALRNDLLDAPDEPDVAAYEATPIEGFGLAMLRGMGWKDSDGEARKGGPAKAPAEVKRRPALLGIGAKADAAKDVELGEFNSKARGKKGRDAAAQGYNPVTLRNKKTGEVISEDDLKKKLESQEMLGDEAAAAAVAEGKEQPRDQREPRDDRDRRGDRDRRRDRDRKDDRREKRRSRSRSRSRSPRDSRRRDRDRDRYRSRSRDAKDRRDRDRDRRRSKSRSRDRDRDSDDEEERRRRRRRRERERERERERGGDRDGDRGEERRRRR